MSTAYVCPRCGEPSEVRVDCWRCELPLVDAGGRVLRACSGRQPSDYRSPRRTALFIGAFTAPIALIVVGWFVMAVDAGLYLARVGGGVVAVIGGAAALGLAVSRWDERRRWARDQAARRREAKTLEGEGIERVRGVVTTGAGGVVAELSDGVLSHTRFCVVAPGGEQAWVGDADMELWSDLPWEGRREWDGGAVQLSAHVVVREGDEVEVVGPARRTEDALGLMSTREQLVHVVLLSRGASPAS